MVSSVVWACRPIASDQLLFVTLVQWQVVGVDGRSSPVGGELHLELAPREWLELCDPSGWITQELIGDERRTEETGHLLGLEDA